MWTEIKIRQPIAEDPAPRPEYSNGTWLGVAQRLSEVPVVGRKRRRSAGQIMNDMRFGVERVLEESGKQNEAQVIRDIETFFDNRKLLLDESPTIRVAPQLNSGREEWISEEEHFLRLSMTDKVRWAAEAGGQYRLAQEALAQRAEKRKIEALKKSQRPVVAAPVFVRPENRPRSNETNISTSADNQVDLPTGDLHTGTHDKRLEKARGLNARLVMRAVERGTAFTNPEIKALDRIREIREELRQLEPIRQQPDVPGTNEDYRPTLLEPGAAFAVSEEAIDDNAHPKHLGWKEKLDEWGEKIKTWWAEAKNRKKVEFSARLAMGLVGVALIGWALKESGVVVHAQEVIEDMTATPKLVVTQPAPAEVVPTVVASPMPTEDPAAAVATVVVPMSSPTPEASATVPPTPEPTKPPPSYEVGGLNLNNPLVVKCGEVVMDLTQVTNQQVLVKSGDDDARANELLRQPRQIPGLQVTYRTNRDGTYVTSVHSGESSDGTVWPGMALTTLDESKIGTSCDINGQPFVLRASTKMDVDDYQATRHYYKGNENPDFPNGVPFYEVHELGLTEFNNGLVITTCDGPWDGIAGDYVDRRILFFEPVAATTTPEVVNLGEPVQVTELREVVEIVNAYDTKYENTPNAVQEIGGAGTALKRSEWYTQVTAGVDSKLVEELDAILRQADAYTFAFGEGQAMQCVWADAIAAWVLKKNGFQVADVYNRISLSPIELVPEEFRNLHDGQRRVLANGGGQTIKVGFLGMEDLKTGAATITYTGEHAEYGDVSRVLNVEWQNGLPVRAVIFNGNRNSNGQLGIEVVTDTNALRSLLGSNQFGVALP